MQAADGMGAEEEEDKEEEEEGEDGSLSEASLVFD
jgi:hypothetical protein